MKVSPSKILHIVNWYPNPFDPIEAQFIKEQIDALNQFFSSEVLLIQVRYGRPRLISRMTSDRERLWILRLPIKSWFVKEIITFLALAYFLFIKYDRSQYRIINFHIAYPLLTYFHLIVKMIRVPVVVNEHWSAYHFNFGIQKELRRIRRIFSLNFPIITVSRSLADDIVKFSGRRLKIFQLPNVVNTRIFKNVFTGFPSPVKYFMLGCWQYPKVPEIILEALKELQSKGYSFSVRIGGYGPYERALREKIVSLGLTSAVSFIGRLDSAEAAREMQSCSFFLHASRYETFSLVCAEALSCGSPVIASAVGGIPEYLNKNNGILVSCNDVPSWVHALEDSFSLSFNRAKVATEAAKMFSAPAVGVQYNEILHQIMN